MSRVVFAIALLLPSLCSAGTASSKVTINIGPTATASLQWGCIYYKTFQGFKMGFCGALQPNGHWIYADIQCDFGSDFRCLPPYQPNY